ncbi:MAG: hypothetical protein HRU25_13575, partial [Psychrobium sp.]|nr:hypothetical protein [Psychrobium sp.]
MTINTDFIKNYTPGAGSSASITADFLLLQNTLEDYKNGKADGVDVAFAVAGTIIAAASLVNINVPGSNLSTAIGALGNELVNARETYNRTGVLPPATLTALIGSTSSLAEVVMEPLRTRNPTFAVAYVALQAISLGAKFVQLTIPSPDEYLASLHQEQATMIDIIDVQMNERKEELISKFNQILQEEMQLSGVTISDSHVNDFSQLIDGLINDFNTEVNQKINDSLELKIGLSIDEIQDIKDEYLGEFDSVYLNFNPTYDLENSRVSSLLYAVLGNELQDARIENLNEAHQDFQEELNVLEEDQLDSFKTQVEQNLAALSSSQANLSPDDQSIYLSAVISFYQKELNMLQDQYSTSSEDIKNNLLLLDELPVTAIEKPIIANYVSEKERLVSEYSADELEQVELRLIEINKDLSHAILNGEQGYLDDVFEMQSEAGTYLLEVAYELAQRVTQSEDIELPDNIYADLAALRDEIVSDISAERDDFSSETKGEESSVGANLSTYINEIVSIRNGSVNDINNEVQESKQGINDIINLLKNLLGDPDDSEEPDEDGDGIPDKDDLDKDGDGIPDKDAPSGDDNGQSGNRNSLGDDLQNAIDDLLGWLPAPPRRRDPLTLDLNGDGIHLTNLEEGVYFDQNGNGIKNLSQWNSPEDGFLVLDRNMNGSIDNGTELFGDSTSINAQGDTAENGYDALAVFDINADGKIDHNDSVYNDLNVWIDKNSDGISQSDELFTLAEIGVASISLSYDANSLTSSYTDTQQVEHMTQSVIFDTSDYYREFAEPLVVSDSIQLLPTMTGTGTVRDLHEAATLSVALENDLASFSSEPNRVEQMRLAESIVISWAKTSEYYEEYNEAVISPTMDKLYIIEAFAGTRVPFSIANSSSQIPTELIEDSYNSIIKMTYLELASQTTLKPYIENIILNFETPVITYDLNNVIDLLSLEPLSADVIATALDLMSVLARFSPADILPLSQYVADSMFSLPEADLLLLTEVLEFNGVTLSTTDGITEVYFESSNMRIIEGNSSVYIDGTNANETLNGTDSADVINAGNGNDTVDGGVGNDIITANGAGSNTLSGGEGDDTISINRSTSYSYQRDYSSKAVNTFIGGAGNDRLEGSMGADTYVFNTGDGQDTINDYDTNNHSSYTSWGKTDKIVLGAGIAESDLSIERVGNHLRILIGGAESGDSITIENAYSSSLYRIEEIVFDDGSKIAGSGLFELPMAATAGDDVISGSGFAETISGLAGDDTINAGSGNDVIDGGLGNDTINAENGNDTVDGGVGNDIITANGAGSNTL